MINFIKKYAITFLIFALLFVIYFASTEIGMANPFLFPTIGAIGNAFKNNWQLMLINMVESFKIMIPSILIALIAALAIGIVLGLNKDLREKLHPVIYAFSVVPAILLSPFVLLIAPNFKIASVFLIAYSIVWPMLFSTIAGIMTIDKRHLDKAKVLELKGIKKLYKVILPAASPTIIAGFINSLRSTFIMLVYAEMYGTRYGMGHFVKKYSEFGMFDYTWAGFIFMVVVLIIVMQIFERIRDYILKWAI